MGFIRCWTRIWINFTWKKSCNVTASVEEVIDEHYLNQINQLDKSEKDLKKKITKFRQDEIDHKDIAYDEGATKKGPYLFLDKIIKTGSRIAINISEKI